MFDLFTLGVYFLILFLIVLFTIRANFIGNSKGDTFNFTQATRLDVNCLFLLFIISFIIGFRYEVGVDWPGYVYHYERLRSSSWISFSNQYYEVGFFAITKVLAILDLAPQWMFFVIALLSWYFIFRSVPRYLLGLFLFFLVCEEYLFWSMNGIRQFLAISIWLFSIRFILARDFKKFVMLILLASTIHLSALLLIPLYFLKYNQIVKPGIFVVLFIVSFLSSKAGLLNRVIEAAVVSLGSQFELAYRYLEYVETNQFGSEEVKLGIIFYLRLIVSLSIILLSRPIVSKYGQLKPYFGIFAIGILFYNLFYENSLVVRFLHYLIILKSMLLSIILVFYWKYSIAKLPTVLFLMLSILILLYAIYNGSNACCPFQFSFFRNVSELNI